MEDSPRSKPHWRSLHWSRCSPWLPRVWLRSRPRCVASTPPAKLPGWWLGAMRVARSVRRGASGLPARRLRFAARAISWSSASAPRRAFSRGSDSALQRWRHSNPANRDGAEKDRGSVTVLAAFMVAALVSTSVGAVHIAAAVLAQHRAQSAADLSVLAAAAWLPRGPSSACEGALRVSGEMGALLRRCDVERLDVRVTVTVEVGGLVGSEAQASARAGPMGRDAQAAPSGSTWPDSSAVGSRRVSRPA